MAVAEKGIDIDSCVIDIVKAENRQADFLALNPMGQTPALRLDDGTMLAESIAIVEYLDEAFPGPSLLGESAEQRARSRMWVRRVDLGVVQPMTSGFRASEGLSMFAHRLRCVPHAADDFKAIARDGLAWLERHFGPGPFIGGEQEVRLADLLLFSFIEFGARWRQPLDDGHRQLRAWHERMSERPSAALTAGPLE